MRTPLFLAKFCNFLQLYQGTAACLHKLLQTKMVVLKQSEWQTAAHFSIFSLLLHDPVKRGVQSCCAGKMHRGWAQHAQHHRNTCAQCTPSLGHAP